jgi:hypothetical protein
VLTLQHFCKLHAKQPLPLQFRKETLPWVADLVTPWLAGRPQPLNDTVAPTELSDGDSRFLTLRYPPVVTQQQQLPSTWGSATSASTLTIHYKIYAPKQQWPENSASQANSNASTTVSETATGHSSASGAVLGRAPAGAGGAGTGSTQDGAAGPFLPPQPQANLLPPGVLMLHGFNGSEFNWRRVAQVIADQVTAGLEAAPGACTAGDKFVAPSRGQCVVAAYDRPPFGLSSRPPAWGGPPEDDPYSVAGGACCGPAGA